METITTDVNMSKTTMIFDDDLRRCSKEAGDPQGGCQYNHLNCQHQRSMLSAKNCPKYTPMQS